MASAEQLKEDPRTNLQKVAFYSFKNLRLDTARSDTCQAEKPQDYLHFCALGNHILDRRDLVCHIIRGEEI